MSNSKRISKDLLSDELRAEIDGKLSGTASVPWDQVTGKPQLADGSWKTPVATPADLPLVGNNPGDIRLTLDTEKYVFTWDATLSQWILIGANDVNVDWVHIQGKPTSFVPSVHHHNWEDILLKPNTFTPATHTHTESDIIGLDKYTKKQVDDFLLTKSGLVHTHTVSEVTGLTEALSLKVDSVAGKGLSSNDFTSSEKLKLEQLSDSASVDYATMRGELDNHKGDLIIHVTQDDRNIWDTVTLKADRSYVDGELAKKATTNSLSGHTGNASIHVTQVSQDKWNGYGALLDEKAPISHIHSVSDVTGLQAQLDASGFTVSPTQPTTAMWYKEV